MEGGGQGRRLVSLCERELGGERKSGCDVLLHCKRIVAGRRRSIVLAVSRAGATGVGLCSYDIISLSITRISGRGLSGMAQDGTVTHGHCFFLTISLSQTHCQPLTTKVHAEQGWNTHARLPPD